MVGNIFRIARSDYFARRYAKLILHTVHDKL